MTFIVSIFNTRLSRCICAILFAYVLLSKSLFAQNVNLRTISDTTLAISAVNYNYNEPSYMTLKANKVRFDYSATYAPEGKWPDETSIWFYKAEFAYSNGKADYSSPISGNLNKTPHWFYEARILAGRDIEMINYVLSPYLGIGFRSLFSDLGYQRTSTYTTMPIGFTHKVMLADNAQLHTNMEYIHLLSGVQKVKLIQNINMDQKNGFGLRISILKHYDTWSFGPTLTYWNLRQSEVGGLTPVYEPKNKTLELGIKGAMHF